MSRMTLEGIIPN